MILTGRSGFKRQSIFFLQNQYLHTQTISFQAFQKLKTTFSQWITEGTVIHKDFPLKRFEAELILFSLHTVAVPQNTGRYLICKDEQENLVSVAITVQNKSSLEIARIAAKPGSKGGGRALIESIIKSSEKEGVKIIASTSLESSKEFYNKMGFIPCPDGASFIYRL